MTVRLPCNCKNVFQDKKYGGGIRIHNICGSRGSDRPARCTSCGESRAGGQTSKRKVA